MSHIAVGTDGSLEKVWAVGCLRGRSSRFTYGYLTAPNPLQLLASPPRNRVLTLEPIARRPRA
jgi:hypothetical protein